MSGFCTTSSPERRKPPQLAENAHQGHRISERERDLIIRLCEENADMPGATSGVVSDLMRRRHGRHIRVDEIDRIMHEDKREWQQRAMALEGHVLAGLREYQSIPRELRAERAEVA